MTTQSNEWAMKLASQITDPLDFHDFLISHWDNGESLFFLKNKIAEALLAERSRSEKLLKACRKILDSAIMLSPAEVKLDILYLSDLRLQLLQFSEARTAIKEWKDEEG